MRARFFDGHNYECVKYFSNHYINAERFNTTRSSLLPMGSIVHNKLIAYPTTFTNHVSHLTSIHALPLGTPEPSICSAECLELLLSTKLKI